MRPINKLIGSGVDPKERNKRLSKVAIKARALNIGLERQKGDMQKGLNKVGIPNQPRFDPDLSADTFMDPSKEFKNPKAAYGHPVMQKLRNQMWKYIQMRDKKYKALNILRKYSPGAHPDLRRVAAAANPVLRKMNRSPFYEGD